MQKYTVIGFYPDTGQRCALYVEADDPTDAEIRAATRTLFGDDGENSEASVCVMDDFDRPELAVVGVVEGHIKTVDKEEYIQEFSRPEDWYADNEKEVMH
jgi:hypothetical protein